MGQTDGLMDGWIDGLKDGLTNRGKTVNLHFFKWGYNNLFYPPNLPF